ncbi:MAG: hypothetical protein A2096_11460 [Spirochaetes bacterium GWF1_41_5]|nr:MAG: hypothetical protein A2096_11460 [Spirochaetes bacterium GWF1_41_5]HBE02979.1 hypothetical protein [Spirochaetia bacterium]
MLKLKKKPCRFLSDNRYCFFLFLFFYTSGLCFARADVFETEIPTGSVIPFSRAYAVLASGDDLSSLLINPAGIGSLFYREVALSFNNLYATGLYNGSVAAASPLGKIGTLGLSYQYIYFDDSELSISDHLIDAAFSRNLFLPGLYAGLAGTMYIHTAKLDDEIADENSRLRFHAGLQYRHFDFIHRIFEPLCIGVTVRNILQSRDQEREPDAKVFDRITWGAGISYLFFKTLTAEAAVYPGNLSLGFEYWVTKALMRNIFTSAKQEISASFSERLVALRLGAILPLSSGKETLISGHSAPGKGITFTAGAGINAFLVSLDYAASYDTMMKFDHKFSLSYKFGFASSYVQITDSAIKDVFSSLYKSYQDLSIGHIKLKNNSKKNLIANISLYIKNYMDSPTSRQVVIRADSEQLFPLYAVFNDKVLELDEDMPVQGAVTVDYVYNNKNIKRVENKNFILYEKNAFTWRNKEQIAVFVTPKDPAVSDFTRQIIQLYNGETSGLLPPVFETAMQVFNALGTYGITYVRDPNSAFAQQKTSGDFVDSIQYPSETLKLKTGDCDDSAVLYCSMLESVGIKTALLDVPGHVLMMFNTEVGADNAAGISKDPNDYIIYKDKVWVAVETTMFKNGFFKAWKEGMLEYRKWKGGANQ